MIVRLTRGHGPPQHVITDCNDLRLLIKGRFRVRLCQQPAVIESDTVSRLNLESRTWSGRAEVSTLVGLKGGSYVRDAGQVEKDAGLDDCRA